MTDVTVSTSLPPEEWTIGSLIALLDERQQSNLRFAEERDRRYAEVTFEREKALKIKETADLAALSLAREIQTYKDEKANELRAQINAERGLYVTRSDLNGAIEKVDATMAPLVKYVTAQQGRSGGLSSVWVGVIGSFSVVGVLAAIAIALLQ